MILAERRAAQANSQVIPYHRGRTRHLALLGTQLYDRTGDEVTLDEVERIAI
jgi:hypothetical protein